MSGQTSNSVSVKRFFCKSIAFTRENISTYHQGNTVDETSQTPLVENQV